MSDSTPTQCPECGTAQQSDAPFCENCGYRLGRTETDLEGYRILPRQPRPDAATTEVEHPEVKLSVRDDAVAATAVEGLPAVERGRHRANAQHQSVRTFHEGMESLDEPSVPTERGHEPIPTPASLAADSFIPASERSGLTQMTLESEQPSRLIVWSTLWLASVAAVAMVVWFYARPAGDDATTAAAAIRITPPPVRVPAGPFLEGLDEQIRSFILTACLNQSEDNDVCDQDKLLRGEFPQKTVELGAYRIDATEVTVEAWQRCVRQNDCLPINYKACQVYTHQGLQTALRVPKSVQEPNVPVTCVTRAEAQAFCVANDGSLPTHSQWERAARGTDGRLFPWGVSWTPQAANWGELDVARVPVLGKIDGHEWSAPPATYPDGKSPVGAYDVAGNVAEWVVGDDPIRGHARGGSWASNPFDLRTTGRLELRADARRADVGFRCVYE